MLELKFYWPKTGGNIYITFNRTMLELKSENIPIANADVIPFNRTMLELK